MQQEVRFIDTKNYRGDDRRNQPRHKIIVPVQIQYNEADEVVKVTNLSHGGCHLLLDSLLNVRNSIKLSFFVGQAGGTYTLGTAIHGRVVHVHKRTHGYSANIDFRGVLFAEHGVEDIIQSYLKK